jgi:hypothetical protein
VRRDVEIAERIYRYVTVILGVKNATVGYGGQNAYVFCENFQDEHFLRQKLEDGFDGIKVVVERRCM